MGGERRKFRDSIFPHDGNNFSVAFYALRYSKYPGEVGESWGIWVKMIEDKWGERWTSFMNNNGELIAQILKVLEERDPLIEIGDKFKDLVMTDHEAEAKILLKDTGYEEIDRKTANKLNPLLEEASRELTSLGINWREI
jgi:hypothetical protein